MLAVEQKILLYLSNACQHVQQKGGGKSEKKR